MATKLDTATKATRPQAMRLPGWMRVAVILGGPALLILTLAAVARVSLGEASPTFEARQVAVLVHLGSVIPAIGIGAYVLLARKGTATHRALGRLWVLLMLAAAASAVFIRNLNGGGFSWLHLFVILVVVTAIRGVMAARAGRIGAHRRHMAGMYLGGLLIPGVFAFLPGRMLWHWLVG